MPRATSAKTKVPPARRLMSQSGMTRKKAPGPRCGAQRTAGSTMAAASTSARVTKDAISSESSVPLRRNSAPIPAGQA